MEVEIAEPCSEAKSCTASSRSSSNASSESEDDEWKPSGRRRPRKLVNAQRSQATRLMWKRKRAARQRADDGGAKKSPGCFPPSAEALADRRFPLCWSDTTLGSSMAGKRRKVNGNMLGKRRVCEQPLSVADVGAGRVLRERLRSGPHRACRPLLFQRDDSRSDDEDSVVGTSFQRNEEHSKATLGSLCDRSSGETCLPERRRNFRPRLLQKRQHTEDIQDCENGLSDEPSLFAEKLEASACRPLWPRLAPRPRMLSRGNYVTEDTEDQPRESECGEHHLSEPMRRSHKKMSLAAKQRWERRRAKSDILGELMTSPTDPQVTPEEMTAPKESASDGGKATFMLPAKLRWKWKSGSFDTSRESLAAKVLLPKAKETREVSTSERTDCSMPAKLRWKQDRSLASEDVWSNGEVYSAGLPDTVVTCPDSSSLERAQDSEKEALVLAREDKVNRRSHAKKLWWQRMKTFSLDSSPAAGRPFAEPIPKFLQAELFPNIRTKRRPRKPTSSKGAENGGTGEPARPSRRSLAMKENWRKRKEAWIQAAAKSVAALAVPPANLADHLAEMSLVEFSSATQLARSMFLAQCRSAQQAALLSEMALIESRGRGSWRHYTTKGIHISTNTDTCDCFGLTCPGCHYPCPKCGSPKCGQECRCNRSYVYEQMEIDGVEGVLRNPLL